MFQGSISLNLELLLLLVSFLFKLELIHISLIVNTRSSVTSLWLSAACADAVTHRNIFYRLYQQNKSSESKVKFRQPGNHCKRVVEAAKLAYANKTKIPLSDMLISLPRNLALKTFGLFLIVSTAKVNLLYLCYLTIWRCCLLCLIKQNSFLKNFLFG